MKTLYKNQKNKSVEKPILQAGTRSYEEVVKLISSIKKELGDIESVRLSNENLRVL